MPEIRAAWPHFDRAGGADGPGQRDARLFDLPRHDGGHDLSGDRARGRGRGRRAEGARRHRAARPAPSARDRCLHSERHPAPRPRRPRPPRHSERDRAGLLLGRQPRHRPLPGLVRSPPRGDDRSVEGRVPELRQGRLQARVLPFGARRRAAQQDDLRRSVPRRCRRRDRRARDRIAGAGDAPWHRSRRSAAGAQPAGAKQPATGAPRYPRRPVGDIPASQHLPRHGAVGSALAARAHEARGARSSRMAQGPGGREADHAADISAIPRRPKRLEAQNCCGSRRPRWPTRWPRRCAAEGRDLAISAPATAARARAGAPIRGAG